MVPSPASPWSSDGKAFPKCLASFHALAKLLIINDIVFEGARSGNYLILAYSSKLKIGPRGMNPLGFLARHASRLPNDSKGNSIAIAFEQVAEVAYLIFMGIVDRGEQTSPRS
jgi:hypothetical protein